MASFNPGTQSLGQTNTGISMYTVDYLQRTSEAPQVFTGRSVHIDPFPPRRLKPVVMPPRPYPVYDSKYVATVYREADIGHHRTEEGWRDPRWTPSMRASTMTLYNQGDRDPANRNQLMVYQSTRINALDTPAKPLPVPDVHKLRYLNNNYMVSDDWY